jgi:uncharacterized protein
VKKRVFLIHGWNGAPDEGWRPWLAQQLTGKADVYNLAMPHPDYPQVDEWVHFLKRAVNTPDEDTILIGHSLGCITVLRFLETLLPDEKIGTAYLIAPFSDDLGIPELSNFFQHMIYWKEIRERSQKFVAIFSDNDPIINHEQYSLIFKNNLHAETIIAHNRLHFSGDDGITEFPELLDHILSFDIK